MLLVKKLNFIRPCLAIINPLRRSHIVFDVESFWTIKVKGHNSDLHINANPEASDKITLKHLSTHSDILTTSLQTEKKLLEINILNQGKDKINLNLEVPITTNIISNINFGNTFIKGLEAQTVEVKSINGDCTLSNLKVSKVDINAQEGDVQCKNTVHGDVTFKLINGNIKTEKLLGNEISLEALSNNLKGHIVCQDIYGKDIYLTTNTGNISAKSLHGESEVSSKIGFLKIGAAEGSLDAMTEKGDIDVFLPLQMESFLSTNKGNVFVKFSENAGAKIDAEVQKCVKDSNLDVKNSNSIDCGKFVKYKSEINGGGKSIRVNAPNGILKLEKFSWIQSLKL